MKLSWQLLSSVINDLGKVYDGRTRYLRLFNVLRKCERIYRSKKTRKSLPDKHAEAAQIIANVCRQNGAMWIKVAQYLSCRPDILPLEYVQAFSELQTLTASHDTCPFDEVNKVLINKWGKHWENSFKSFELIPMASGSIAQVYKAELLSSDKNQIGHLAVKVRVPHVEKLYEQDAIVLRAIAKCIEPFYKEFDVPAIISEIIETTLDELNFNIEAKNIKLYKKRADVNALKVPQIIDDRSSDVILCTEWIEGETLKNIIKSKCVNAPQNLPLVRQFALEMLKDIFIHGQYHGDPHPGNVLFAHDMVYLIDFGLMGELTDKQRTTYLFLLMAMTGKVVVNNYKDLFKNAGFAAENSEIFERVGALIHDLHENSDLDITARLETIMEALRENKVILPQGFVGILRVILLLSGLFYSADISFEDIFVESLKAA